VIGPVKLHLFAFVRDGVDAFLVSTLRDEIPLVVIATEESVQVGEDFIF
jgi:hypothetical protein